MYLLTKRALGLAITALFVNSTLHYAHAEVRRCDGPSSGLVTIALSSKRFPVAQAAKALRTSPHPSFTLLAGPSFGRQYSNVAKLIGYLRAQDNSLQAKPRCITVIVYGDCGPCRTPRRPAGLFSLIAKRDSISRLNRKLERADVRTLTQHAKEYERINLNLPELPGVQYIFMPALEDNYSDGAYQTLRILARQTFAGRLDISVGRNPLRHSRGARPLEIHSYDPRELSRRSRGDIVTGDGDVLCFPGERCKGYSVGQVRALAQAARQKGVHFLVWRPENQGLPLSIGNNPAFIPVSRRKFRVLGIPFINSILR